MPDIHHNVAAQLRHMERLEMVDCRCGALIPVRPYLGTRQGRAPVAPANSAPQAPAKVTEVGPAVPSSRAPSSRQALAVRAERAAEEEAENRETRPTNKNESVTAPSSPLAHRLPLRSTMDNIETTTGRPAVEKIISSKDQTVPDAIDAKQPGRFPGRGFREFTVSNINDSRTLHSETHYLVHWADSITHKDLTRVVDSGFVVDVDGEEWEAVSCTDISTNEDCDELCYVQWKDTWMPERLLDNARDAILEFEAMEIANAVLGQGTGVRSSIERTPPDNEPSPPPTSRQDRQLSRTFDLAHDTQPKILRLIFKPEFGADYRPGLRELVERVIGCGSPLLLKWPEQNDKRHLLFRELWVARALTFDMTRSERMHAAFAQISGVEQRRPCECCGKGNGPFMGCVTVANFANGACANCASGRHSKKCNFHLKTTEQRRTPRIDTSASPSPTPNRQPSPELGNSPSPPRARRSHSRRWHPRVDDSPEADDVLPTPPTTQQDQSSSPGASMNETSTMDIGETVLPLRSKRTASFTLFPFDSDSDDDSGLSNWQFRPSKLPKVSAESSSDDGDGWIKMEYPTYPVVWEPSSFRHACCGPHEARPCQDPRLVDPISSASGALRRRGRVMADRAFTEGEASEDEVKYILGWAPCYFVESLHKAWKEHRRSSDRLWTRDSFLSRHFTHELNDAVSRFCPRRQLPLEDQKVIFLD